MFNKSTFKPVNAEYARNALYAYSSKLDERAKIRKDAIDAADTAYNASIKLIKLDYVKCILKFVKDTVVVGLVDIFPDIEEKAKYVINTYNFRSCVTVSFDALGNQYENLMLEYEQRAGYVHCTDAALWHISINGIRIKSERLRYNIFKELRKEIELRNQNAGVVAPTTTYAEFVKVRDAYLTELCRDITKMLNDEFPNKFIKAVAAPGYSEHVNIESDNGEFIPINYSFINRRWYYRSDTTYEISYDTVLRVIRAFYDNKYEDEINYEEEYYE